MLYSDDSRQNMAEVAADDLSKCSIKEVEKPVIDRTGGVAMNRLPLQAPQSIQDVMTNRSMYFATSPPLFSAFFLSASLMCTAGIMFKECRSHSRVESRYISFTIL